MDVKLRTNSILRFARRSAFWIAVILALGASFWLGRYTVYRTHPELSGAEQAAQILANVGKLIQLPNETPTMATIKDAGSAKRGQPFLVNAENGDILIVYQNPPEALLYRPSTDKLINVGPVNDGAATQTVSQSVPPATATSTNAATSTKSKK
ncbi:MAG: hypothetical protein WAN50_00025 [Minisyncoccia bacterium]